MKHLLISVIITAVSALVHPAFAGDACMDHLLSVHITNRNETTHNSDREMDTFRTLAEKALTLRAETIKVGQSIIRKTEEETPLSGTEINLINAGISEHLTLREELLKTAQLHECRLDNNATTSRSLTPDDHLKSVFSHLFSRP